MPIIVATGTNGFIGTNIVQSLLSHKINKSNTLQIHCADIPSSQSRALHQRFANNPRVSFVVHSELAEHIRAMPQPPLAVIHNGACSSTEETDPEIFRDLNLEYSQEMWRVCSELGIPLIYASSASVYGDGSQGFSAAKKDQPKYQPMNLYAKSKCDFDRWTLEQSKCPPTWFGLRYFNVYGYHEAHKGRQASMVLHGFKQIREHGSVRLYKSTDPRYPDGGQVRDFVWVRDVVDLTMKLLEIALKREAGGTNAHPIEGQGCFINVAPSQPRTWNDLMKAIFAAMGIAPRIEYVTMPQSLARQYQNYTCADLTTLHELGVNHTFASLEEGVADYVKELIRTGG